MKWKELLKKYWPIGVAIIVLVVVFVIMPRPYQELKQVLERERKERADENKISDRKIKSLQQDSVNVRKEMAEDDKRFEAFRKASDAEFERLRKSKINLSGAGKHKLDSLRKVLFSTDGQ